MRDFRTGAPTPGGGVPGAGDRVPKAGTRAPTPGGGAPPDGGVAVPKPGTARWPATGPNVIDADAEAVLDIENERMLAWGMDLGRVYPMLPPEPYGLLDLGCEGQQDTLIPDGAEAGAGGWWWWTR